MKALPNFLGLVAVLTYCNLSANASAEPFSFSTGNPDGRMASLSRTANGSVIQTETADDFVLGKATSLDHATFTGLIPTGASLSSISRVEIEFYHVFPGDSVNPPSGNVPSRVNSPGDVEIGAATRDSLDGSLSFSASVVSPTFSALNSVVNGINKFPGQNTGGEGPVSEQEVQIGVDFEKPVLLPGDHYFFRPEAELTDGNFLLLSAPRPITAPGTPFMPDLQAWIRNDNLAPDWLRIGTDIVGGDVTFNETFSLSGAVVPEAGPWVLVSCAALAAGAVVCRGRMAKGLQRA